MIIGTSCLRERSFPHKRKILPTQALVTRVSCSIVTYPLSKHSTQVLALPIRMRSKEIRLKLQAKRKTIQQSSVLSRLVKTGLQTKPYPEKLQPDKAMLQRSFSKVIMLTSCTQTTSSFRTLGIFIASIAQRCNHSLSFASGLWARTKGLFLKPLILNRNRSGLQLESFKVGLMICTETYAYHRLCTLSCSTCWNSFRLSFVG